MKTMITVTAQKVITHKSDEDYDDKQEEVIRALEKLGWNVDIEDEEEM